MGKNKNVPPSSQSQASVPVTRTEVLATSYSGPIPPAEQLRQYEDICPGAAERILAMAEAQSRHRQGIQAIIVRSGARNSLLGVIFAFVLGLSTIVGGVFLAFNGLAWPGALLGSAGLIGLVSVFIYGTRSNKEERANKRDNKS